MHSHNDRILLASAQRLGHIQIERVGANRGLLTGPESDKLAVAPNPFFGLNCQTVQPDLLPLSQRWDIDLYLALHDPEVGKTLLVEMLAWLALSKEGNCGLQRLPIRKAVPVLEEPAIKPSAVARVERKPRRHRQDCDELPFRTTGQLSQLGIRNPPMAAPPNWPAIASPIGRSVGLACGASSDRARLRDLENGHPAPPACDASWGAYSQDPPKICLILWIVTARPARPIEVVNGMCLGHTATQF